MATKNFGLKIRFFGLVTVCASLYIFCANTSVYANSSWADETFGIAGVAQTSIEDPGANLSGLAVSPDGKIYVSGTKYVNSVHVGTVERLNEDGSPDFTFGNSGIYQESSSSAIFTDVDFDSQSRIYILDRQGRVIRLTENGQIDSTFGNSGILEFTPELNINSSYGSISISSNDVLYVTGWGGTTGQNTSHDAFVASFDNSGNLITSFGSGGTTYLPQTVGQDLIYDSVIDSDGNIILSGAKNFGSKFWLVKVLPNGQLDPTFGVNGEIATSAPTGYSSQAWENISTDPQGKILVTGAISSNTISDSDIFVARFSKNGQPEFQRRINFGRFESGKFVGQGNGGIYVVGNTSVLVGASYVSTTYLTRLTPSGSNDSSFGSNGVLTRTGSVHDVAKDTYGNILISGNVYPSYEKQVVKYLDISSPSSPFNLRSTPYAESIVLNWNQPIEDGGKPITDYLVEFSTDGNNWVNFNDGISPSTETLISSLVPNSQYYLRVSATNSFARSVYSAIHLVRTALPERPGPPVLSVSASDLVVNLNWRAPSTGGGFLSGYLIQRKIGSGNWENLAFSADSTLSYTSLLSRADAGPVYYRVKAINDGGDSEFSNVVSINVIEVPFSPTNLRATQIDDTIQLTWNQPSNWEIAGDLSYSIEVTTNGTSWTTINPSLWLNTTTAVYDAAMIGTSYRFRVIASNSVGSSQVSTSSNLVAMSSQTTAPAPTAPPAITTVIINTPEVVINSPVATIYSPTVTVGGKLSAASIANGLGIVTPKKSTMSVVISKSSKKYCKVKAGKVVGIKTGACVATVTVQAPKPKKGKRPSPVKKSVTIQVS